MWVGYSLSLIYKANLSRSAKSRVGSGSEEALMISENTAQQSPAPAPTVDLLTPTQMGAQHPGLTVGGVRWDLYPFAGARMLRDVIRQEGHAVGRTRVGSLMAKMGVEALYRKPNTRQKADGTPIHPDLLRDLSLDRSNQVWAADITYIPMRRGFIYLMAVIDGYSRKVLAWRVSNTLTTDFCLDAAAR